MAHQKADFSAIDRFIQVDKEVRYAKIAVIFRNFIFQDEMVSKGIPGQLTNQTMILMQIMPVMGEDDVWRFLPFQLLKKILISPPMYGKKPSRNSLRRILFSLSADRNASALA